MLQYQKCIDLIFESCTHKVLKTPISEIVNFEAQIAKAKLSKNTSDECDKFLNLSIQAADDRWGSSFWPQTIKEIFYDDSSWNHNIITVYPHQFDALESILQKSDLNLLKDWLRVKVALGAADYGPNKITQIKASFFSRIYEVSEQNFSADLLSQKVVRSLAPLDFARYLKDEYFPAERFELASSIIDECRSSFLDLVEKSTMLTQRDKSYISYKAQKMEFKFHPIGSSCSLLDSNEISDSDSIYNFNLLASIAFDEMVRKLVVKDRAIEENISAVSPNAFYSALENTVYIGLGMLSNSLLPSNGSRITALCRFGFIIAHEIGHSVDNIGISVTPEDLPRHVFDQSTREKYRQFVEEIRVHARKILPTYGLDQSTLVPGLNESVADVVGVKIISNIFESDLKEGESSRYISDNLVNDVRREWARLWQGKTPTGALVDDIHFPMKLRFELARKYFSFWGNA